MHCSNGVTWMLATCRAVEILCWDRGHDRRAEQLECQIGMTLWQPASWLCVLNITDMCDKDVVIMQRMTMTNISTASKALYRGCVVWNVPILGVCWRRARPVGLSRSSRAVCVLNSRFKHEGRVKDLRVCVVTDVDLQSVSHNQHSALSPQIVMAEDTLCPSHTVQTSEADTFIAGWSLSTCSVLGETRENNILQPGGRR